VPEGRRASIGEPADGNDWTVPIVMHPASMSRAQREQVRRIVTPKPTTGRLEVPQDITSMWNTAKGKEKLFSLWCKSGGVKAGFGTIDPFKIISI